MELYESARPLSSIANPQPQGQSTLPPVNPAVNQQYPYSAPANPAPNPSSAPQPTYQNQGFAAPASNPAPASYNTFAASPLSTPDDYATVDYLNRIAPIEQRNVNRFAIFGLIGAVITAAVVGLIVMISSQGPNANGQIPAISSRIDTLSEVAKEETTKLTQTEISEANASLSSALTSMKSQLDTIVKDRKLKISSDTKKDEKTYLEKLQKKLGDAHQKGTLDRTYTTTMTYELSMLKSQINKLKRSAGKDKTVAAFCNSAISSIDTILASYNKFSASK